MDQPSRPEVILDLILQASSQDPQVLRVATDQLKLMETQPGFHVCLAKFYSQTDLPLNARMVSVLYLKNCVDRYWRPTCPQGVPEMDKAEIRSSILSNISINEREERLGNLVALLIGKISRVDWPRFWPQLIPDLLHHKAWITLHQVVKSQASKRLSPSRALFHQLSGEMLPILSTTWHEMLSHLSASSGEIERKLNDTLMVTKILAGILPESPTISDKDTVEQPTEEVSEVLQLCLSTIRGMISSRPSLVDSGSPNHVIEKRDILVRHLVKALVKYQEKKPFAFQHLMIRTLNDLLDILTSLSLSEPVSVRRQLLLLFHNLLSLPPQSNINLSILQNARDLLLSNHAEFSTSRFSHLIRCLCQRDCRLSLNIDEDEGDMSKAAQERERERILRDTDAGLSSVTSDGYKWELEELGSCLLVRLVHTLGANVAPVFLGTLQDLLATDQPSNQETSLRLFSRLLPSLVMVSPHLLSSLDVMIPRLTTQFLSNPVDCLWLERVQCRMISLLGRWVDLADTTCVTGDGPRDCRVDFSISVLSGVLSWTSKSIYVRLTASYTLRCILDRPAAKLEPTIDSQWIGNLTINILRLIEEVNDNEVKLELLRTLHHLISHIDPENRPLFDPVIQVIPSLWKFGDSEPLLQCLLLSILVTLTSLLTPDPHLVDLSLSLISLALTGEEVESLALASLNLLQTILNNINDYPPGVDSLIPHLSRLPSITPEYLMELMSTLESVLFSGGPGFVDTHTNHLVYFLSSSPLSHNTTLLANSNIQSRSASPLSLANEKTFTNSEARIAFYELIENFLLVNIDGFLALATNENGSVYKLVSTITHILIDETPIEAEKDNCPLLTHSQLVVLARIAMSQNDLLWRIVDKSESMSRLVDLWLIRLDNMASSVHRKLCALAPLRVLTLRHTLAEDKFDPVINALVQILHENQPSIPNCTSNERPGSLRVSLYQEQDLFHSPSLLLAQQSLQNLQNTISPTAITCLMNSLDPVIAKQLMECLSTQSSST